MSKKILVCGSREWDDYDLMYSRLAELGSYITLVHGAARGADSMAGEIGKQLGWRVIPMPADWRKHGKAAGHIRNAQMLTEHPDIVEAFAFIPVKVMDPVLKTASRGTQNMVNKLMRAHIPHTLVYDEFWID